MTDRNHSVVHSNCGCHCCCGDGAVATNVISCPIATVVTVAWLAVLSSARLL